jgi:hypothetical protein
VFADKFIWVIPSPAQLVVMSQLCHDHTEYVEPPQAHKRVNDVQVLCRYRMRKTGDRTYMESGIDRS